MVIYVLANIVLKYHRYYLIIINYHLIIVNALDTAIIFDRLHKGNHQLYPNQSQMLYPPF